MSVSVWLLATQLAAALSQSENEVYQSLRVCGFVGDVSDPVPLLRHVKRLAPQFSRLRADLIGLAPILDCFLQASSFLDVLVVSESGTFDAMPDGNHQEIAINPIGVDARVAKVFSEYERGLRRKRRDAHENDHKVVDDWLSISWLRAACPFSIKELRKIIPANEYDDATVWAFGGFDFWLLSHLLTQKSGPALRANRLTDVGLEKWFASFDEEDFDCIPSAVRSVGKYLTHLASVNPPLADFPVPGIVAAPSLDLSERFLTRGHWDYPRPAQRQHISKLLRKNQDNPIWRKTVVEQLVMAIAIVTGRSCEDALNLKVLGVKAVSTQADFSLPLISEPTIQLVLANGYQNMFVRAIMRLPLKGGKSIDLPLPERVVEVLKGYVGFHQGGALIEFLPVSSQPWPERVNAFVEHCLQCSPGQAKRILRDTLAREVFAASRNLAVVGWLNPTRFIGRLRRSTALPVLAHYLDPLGVRTYQSYWDACGEIFGGLGAVASVGTSNCHDHGNHRVPITHQRTIAAALRRRVTAPDASVIEVHNAYVDYCLLMLIVATGHRASGTPFWFARDLRLEDRLAFVCDKIVVGSEARFVPLPDVVVTIMRCYQQHLIALRRHLGGEHRSVLRHIDEFLFTSSRRNAVTDRREPTHPLCGYFFKVSKVGSVIPTNTRALELSICGIAGAPTVRDFRAAIADALWGMGLSGTDVATFLGHAGDLHPFGPASLWSVQVWADRIRPSIAKYLEERGWTSIESPLAEKEGRVLDVHYCVPDFDSGLASYEGRNRETQLAKARAKKIVVQILSEELVSDCKQIIDDNRLKEIRNRIDLEFAGDPRARDVIHGVLASEIKKISRSHVHSTAATVNLVRLDPSPVGVNFGRHLEIASRFRNEWESRVGLPIGGEMDWAERAAQLSISLVVHAAVLAPERVMALLSSALGEDPGTNYGDIIVLRGEVRNLRYEYDFAVAGDSITTALWIGLQREWQSVQGKPDEAKRDFEIRKRLEGILVRLLGRMPSGKSWHLSDLCQIFRAWWFLRLPGSLFSIATGDHVGPAPHRVSERSLFAENEPEQAACQLTPPQTKPAVEDASADAERAITAIGKLVARARGLMSMGTAHTRRQRMALRHQLDTFNDDADLARWVAEEPIVGLAVGFLSHLLEHGGPRQRNLKFSSIQTYKNLLVPHLIREGWGQSIEEWDEEEFETFYRRLIVNADKPDPERQRLLYEFHQYLRGSIDAPYVTSFPNLPPVPQRCRTSIVTVAARGWAKEKLSAPGANRHPLSDQAAALLGLGFDYGLRSREAAGLEVEHFDNEQPKFLAVKKNVIRDLKTSAARRVIPVPCPDAATTRRLNILRERAINGPSAEHYLFGSVERPTKISGHDASVRLAKTVLRCASSNTDVVFHDARATMSTELMTALHMIDDCFRPLSRALKRLVRPALLASGDLQAITRAGENNPFVLDSVARLLGHRSVDTLLNVYYRASFIAIAGATFAACRDIRINDQQLATMLRLTRSAISKQRKSLAGEPEDGDVSLNRLVSYSIAQMYSDASHTKEGVEQAAVTANCKAIMSSHVPWELLDRLVTMRKETGLSLGDLQNVAEAQWDLRGGTVASFLDKYRLLVTELGFDDFEPDNSEFLYAKPSHGKGVIRGRAERAASVALAQTRYEANQKFRDALARVCRCWFERVAAERPRFAIRTLDELCDLMFVLEELGVKRPQFEFTITGTLPEDLAVALSTSYSEIPCHTGQRSSRGNRNVKVGELGVDIRQLAGAIVGDGRDIHRLVALLSCCPELM